MQFTQWIIINDNEMTKKNGKTCKSYEICLFKPN